MANSICISRKHDTSLLDRLKFIGIHWHDIPSAHLHFFTIQRCLRCTAAKTPSLCVFSEHRHHTGPHFLQVPSLLESHDPWKDMICILTTAGLLLGSRGVLSKNIPGSSVHLSHARFHYSYLPQPMLPESSRSFAT